MSRRSWATDAVSGLLIGLVAATVMAAVAAIGVHLALTGTTEPAGTGPRLSAAVVAAAVGAPVDVTADGTFAPGTSGAPGFASRPDVAVALAGRLRATPLGVTLAGAAALVGLFLLVRRRRPEVIGDRIRAAGAVLGFGTVVAALGWLGRGGPVEAGRFELTFQADPVRTILGGLLLAALALGACLVGRRWRPAVAAIGSATAGLTVLGTVGIVIAALVVGGGATVAGLGLLGGANVVLGGLPWALGVPWSVGAEGPLAELLQRRMPAGGQGAWRWWIGAVALAILVLAGIIAAWRERQRTGLIAGRRESRPGGPAVIAAGRLAVVAALALAGGTAAAGTTVTATASVLILHLPEGQLSITGNILAAAFVGLVGGFLVGLVGGLSVSARERLVPTLRRERHGEPTRR